MVVAGSEALQASAAAGAAAGNGGATPGSVHVGRAGLQVGACEGGPVL